MAICHMMVQSISRSDGRSATASAAYRSGEEIHDKKVGVTHDYTRKSGVVESGIILPENSPEEFNDRSTLWNAVEASEKRKNSIVAREIEIALPDECTADERKEIVQEMAQHLVDKHGVGVDYSIHEPGKEGDKRNHHAHIMFTTRRIDEKGLGAKTRELNNKTKSRKAITAMREKLATATNEVLERGGHDERVDPRSLKDQGIDRKPTVHLGPEMTAMERKGIKTARGDHNRRIKAGAEAVVELDRRREDVATAEAAIDDEYKRDREMFKKNREYHVKKAKYKLEDVKEETTPVLGFLDRLSARKDVLVATLGSGPSRAEWDDENKKKYAAALEKERAEQERQEERERICDHVIAVEKETHAEFAPRLDRAAEKIKKLDAAQPDPTSRLSNWDAAERWAVEQRANVNAARDLVKDRTAAGLREIRAKHGPEEEEFFKKTEEDWMGDKVGPQVERLEDTEDKIREEKAAREKEQLEKERLEHARVRDQRYNSGPDDDYSGPSM